MHLQKKSLTPKRTHDRSTSLLLALALVAGITGCVSDVPEVEGEVLLHGETGVRPFWNRYSVRYIFPPAFEVVDSIGTADAYGVAVSTEDGLRSSAISSPSSSLAAVWNELPNGRVTFQIERNPSGDSSEVLATIETIKSPGFSAVNQRESVDVKAAGMAGLEAVLKLDKVSHWIEPGGPFPNYQLWVHPSKLMGVLSQGMLFLSQQTTDSVTARDAELVALAAANFLLQLREPPNTPLSGWTHSYWDGVDRGEHPIYMDQIMTLYPSEAAMAFLDLHDETNDPKWWDAALEIAETYKRVQRSDGTWYLLMRRESGEPVGQKLLVPISVITFLDRIATQYKNTDYQETREAAFNWVMENPVQTYAWDAQFEDTRPKNRYKNLSHREAAGLARLLFTSYSDPEMTDLAQNLLLFVEDQFVVWTHEDMAARTNWFSEGSKWNGDLPDGGKDWFLPAALEQYLFYTPIAGTTSNVIHAFCAAYDATGITEYRAKARALSRSLIDAQQFHGGGEIPTHLRKTLPEENWLNNSVYSARTLIDASCL